MSDRDLLVKRMRNCREKPEAEARLLDIWPGGSISKATDHQLAAMEAAIRTVEQEFRLGFEPFEPEPEPAAELTEPPPVHEKIDEGERLTDDELNGIRAVLATLDEPNVAFVEQMAAWTKDAGHYIGFVNYPFRRRAEIAKALIHLSSMTVADAFDLIATVTGADDHADVGEVVGTMTITQAKLLQMADTDPTNKGATNDITD